MEMSAMLNILLGKIENVVYNTSVFFKNQYNPEWLKDPQVRQMIQDVDQSKVLDTGLIESPVLGLIPPASLSGGVKTLILISKLPEKLFNASNCGDNCAAWLLKIGEEQNVTVNLRHVMDFGPGTFNIHIENEDKTVHSMEELARIAGRYV